VLKTLLDRKLIITAGRKAVLGKPVLYKTSKEFLVQFGLKNLGELPTLKEFEELSRMALGDEAIEEATAQTELPLRPEGEPPTVAEAESDGGESKDSSAEAERAAAMGAVIERASLDLGSSDAAAVGAAPEVSETESQTVEAPSETTES
jgi:segregation and condensation protein B